MTKTDCAVPAASLLRTAARRLARIEYPALTAQALLAHILGVSRTELLARPELVVLPEAQADFERCVRRASAGEPLAYLIGRREFYGLDFHVDARVLVPRPETELLVDLALSASFDLPAAPFFMDAGTGSGCIAIALAVHRPAARGVAVDISAAALAVARLNALRHNVADRLAFVRGDLLAAFARAPVDLLVANLPYIPSAELERLPVSRHEPPSALDGGHDGLALIRRLLAEAPRAVTHGGCLLLEIGADQGASVAALAHAAFPTARIEVHKDLAGLDRVVGIWLPQ